MELDLAPVIHLLHARTWIQGTRANGDGVTAHGAVHACEALPPGDAHVIAALLWQQGLTEDWNNTLFRTKEEVLAKLRSIDVSDAALEDVFGPQWSAITALVRRAAELNADETMRLSNALSAQDPPWVEAFGPAQCAVGDNAANAANHAAQEAATLRDEGLVDRAVRRAGSFAAGNAAVGLAARAMIGQRGFTQQHYDTLTGPWAQVVGPAHPND